jgi:TetR/AcrR family transcriptional regulator
MFSKFLNLDKEKQDRIINAAIKEFAEKGYDRASTNEIVKEAGISNGLLFHYFQNKKQMFLFLFDYCYELVTD